jgi:5-methylthioadenosine/S-adenosylhomocysteine deaminase
MFDTILYNGTIITVDERFSIIGKGAVAVSQGKISTVWEYSEQTPLPKAKETIDAQGGLIMPGLVNSHTHLPMALFRGLADDLPLQRWLNDHIFPAEARHINPESVGVGTRLSCAEMLLGGITTCCDGYFLATHCADSAVRSGLRAIIGQGVIDFPAPGIPDPALNVAAARTFVEQWRGRSEMILPSIFCHSPYTCSSKTLVEAKKASRELGVLFQIHVAETQAEREQVLLDHGCSPVAYLDRLGILDEHTLLVHAVWVDNQEIEIIARRNARVAHCPESNMKLASGVAPVPDFLSAGISVGLGTDGCASNNDLDLFGEMDAAAKLHKVRRSNPTVMDAQTVVRMATIQGAMALGLDRLIGSLEPGKCADIIIVGMDQPHLTPVYHPASHLVYVCQAADVRHVMIDGKWVVRNRCLLTMEVEEVLRAANALKRAIAQ